MVSSGQKTIQKKFLTCSQKRRTNTSSYENRKNINKHIPQLLSPKYIVNFYWILLLKIESYFDLLLANDSDNENLYKLHNLDRASGFEINVVNYNKTFQARNADPFFRGILHRLRPVEHNNFNFPPQRSNKLWIFSCFLEGPIKWIFQNTVKWKR